MRSRNKPSSTFVERTESEILRERELSIKRGYEVGLIRGRKETIDKACKWFEEWVKSPEIYTMEESLVLLRKAMEE